MTVDRTPFSAAALALWRLSRPATWLVSLVPMLIGYVVASRRPFPGLDVWTAFWADAVADGATTAEFAQAFAVWLAEAAPFLLACAALGPLAWLATLLVNDVHDLPGDRVNPRKAASPLVRGVVSSRFAHGAAYAAAAATLGVAAFVSLPFLALVAGALVLAWAYSAPPLRLKTRPGADLAVNAFGVAVLCGAAGWSLARPLAEAPWAVFPHALLVATAVYLPTTLVDHAADREAGYPTFATRFGPRVAYLAGFWAWVAANLGAVGLAFFEVIIPRGMLPILVVFTPLMVWQYHAFIGRAATPEATVRGIVLCSLTFAAVNTVFVLMYTGLWRP